MGKTGSKQKLNSYELYKQDLDSDVKRHESVKSLHGVLSPHDCGDLDLELALNDCALSDETAMFIHKVGKRIRKNITVLKSETPEA